MKSSLIEALLILGLGALWIGGPDRAVAQSNGVLREVYTGIGGTAVSDLTNNASFPDNPTTVEVITDFFEAPTDVDENYGQRLSAYILPPTTGSYVFWIASDDNSTLFLSTDDNPANKRAIASVPGWTSSRQWTAYTQQKSSAISLTGGQRYYIEALMKEGGGGDNLAVRWQLPGGAIEEPIPASRLLVFGLGPPQITQQPANVTVLEGGSATFTVRLARTFGATYRWLRNGSDIAGATNASYTLSPVSLADGNSQFRCSITNPQGSTNSSTATLTVSADTTPPTIASVVNLGDNTIVSVLFSEPVEASSATSSANYSIDNGIGTPLSAKFGTDTQTVVLKTGPLSSGTTYTLTVNNVRDRASSPNTIAANSQKTFTLDYPPLDAGFILGASEPIGPSSRRTGLIISEIMYHPTNRVDGKNVEFVEIYNSQPFFEDISGYRLTGTIDYTFPASTTIAARSYLVVAPAPADVQSVYGITGVLGGFTNGLSNGSGTIRLRNKQGAVLLDVNYSGEPPWPVAADGAGHSLVLARPSWGESNPKAWSASDLIGGTPGTAETPAANPYRTVVINEILAHTDDPELDYIELYNYSAQAVSLAGCVLTDDPATNRFVIPNVSIPARGFVVYNQSEMGFSLSAAGETIYLKNPAGTKVLDALRFEGQENGVATGRYPDGAPCFNRLQARTPGTSNARIRLSEVVINEIMFNPISGDSDDEFVELYNRAAGAINLTGWRLRGGVSFTFPTNAVIPANGYVVVANDAARLLTNYPYLTSNNTFGNYGGTLGNRGDRIKLSKPDEVISTNNGVVVTNTIHILMNEVTYGEGGRWGRWADGGGSSLELIDPNSDNRFPSNWADSDETAKSTWTNIEFSGVLDNGNGGYPADTLHVGLLGIGECLIDNVEVVPAGGANAVPNSTFEAGLSGWVLQGSHSETTLENSGYNSSRSLHIRADSRCDTGANRIRTGLASTLASGSTATLRAKFRWLHGSPEPLLRLKGNWLEATGRIAVPSNLGTPGLPNSRKVTNAGPPLHDVIHSPVLPAAGQAVTITTQADSPNGLASLVVKYRLDPSTNFTTVSMTYNGAGLYGAQIPGQPAGAVVGFYIEAADNFTPSALSRFPNGAPAQECLVRFGEPQPSGTLGTYRLWLSSKTVAQWISREKLNNAPLDATFVYNNYRVIYNAGSLYSGSPFHMGGWNGPTNNLCDYVLNLPADDPFLGSTDAVLASVGNLDNDDTVQREQAAFWILNKLEVPFNYRRFIRMYVNGVQRGRVFEDAQQPNSDLVEQWFPDDSNGDLHKIEDWFEFNDAANSFNNTDATLQNFTTSGGQKKLARYRWIWRKRASDAPSAYANLFSAVDALNSTRPQPYTALVDGMVDAEEWMRVIAVEHIVGNWDSYGYNRGKNMYGYKPVHGKWALLAWDIDFVLGSGSDSTTTEINPLTMPLNDPVMLTMVSHPPYQRAFWRALADAVNGPLLAANINPLLDAKYNALTANGISLTSPNSGLKTWIQDRRTFLLNRLATVAASFAVTSNGGSDFSTNKNYVPISGTAPIGVKTISINGIAYPLTWTTVSNWTANIALGAGANSLAIAGYDLRGNPVANSTDTITITYTGASELPQDRLVLNEIMYNPVVPDASFIELYNTSTVNAFDLSGFRLDGADFVFPGGSIIQPSGFLVIANDATAFAAVYGSSIPLAGEFNGKLSNGGETLKLVKPGATPDQDLVIDQVTYDSAPPWPTAANGFGPSLQLIDPLLDNNRVANWAVATTNTASGPQWQFVSVTGTATSSRLYVYLQAAGDVYLDDIQLVAGSVPAAGQNYIQNGDFESALSGPWQLTANTANSSISGATNHAGNGSLHLVCNTGGTTLGDSVWQDTLPLVTNATYTLSYWYLPKTTGGTLTLRLSGSGVRSDQNITSPPSVTGTQYTPGAANSVKTTLAPFPPVWLNEVEPNNVAGTTDRFGHHHPWVELYNGGTSAINLGGFYLADNYMNLTQWAFPANTTLNAGQFLVVYLDGSPGESIETELHATFAIAPVSGSVVLTKVVGAQTTVVDYLNYNLVNADRSYGAFPDGTSAKRRKFFYATPGSTNNNSWPAVPVTINEWMAANTSTIFDPADGNYDDWFELYNAGPTAVDLSGYTLTDNYTNKAQFTIPPGYTVPAGGFLLVWADNGTNENTADNSSLHVNFRLSQAGEEIWLIAPNGTNVDGVSFGPQTNDVSQGRWPDGNSGQFNFLTRPTPDAANIIGGSTSNSPPVLMSIGKQSVNEGRPLTFTAGATDPDIGQTLTYTLDPGAPPGASINSFSGVFLWTPTETQGPGSYTLTVRVTDNGSPALNDFETITVTVNEVNSAPSLAALGDVTIDEGSLLTFTATATDPDSPANTLRFTVDPGAPAGAAIDASSGVFTWTPTEAQGPGVYSVTIRVTDDGSPALSTAETFNLSVNEVNSAPSLAAITDATVAQGSLLSFTAAATDPDVPADALTFSLDPGAPAGAAIDLMSGVFSWTPTAAQGQGIYPVSIRVTDNGSPALSTTEAFNITVNEVNTAPVLAPIGNKIVDEENTLSFILSATDANLPAQTLTFSMDPGAPTGASFDAATRTFSWTPSESQGPSTNTVTFRVSDNGSPPLIDFETVTITVNEVNTAPVLAPIGNKTVEEGSVLTFTLSASDADLPAQLLTYSVEPSAPAGASFDATTRTFTWTPDETQGPGTTTVTFRVSDNGSPAMSASESIVIVVNEVNNAPVLAAILDQSITAGNQLVVTNTATDPDVPLNELSFSLAPGAPAGAAIDPVSGVFTWTPSSNQAPSTNAITVRVADNGAPSLSDSRSFTILVSPAAELRVTGIGISIDSVVTLTWSSQAGKTYRVQFKDNLNSTTWDLLGEFNASGSATSATNNISGTPQRYYRIQQSN